MTAEIEYTIEKIGETMDGDVVYVLKLGDREVGAFEVVPIDEEIAYIKKGAALDPSPMIVEKIKIPTDGKSIEEAIKANIGKFTSSARYVSHEEATKVIEYIKSRVLQGEVTEEGESEE